MDIRDRIAAANLTWYPGPRRTHYRDWLRMIRAFEQKWGANRLPGDIAASRDEVREGLRTP